VRIALIVLSVALVASVVAGLAGLWPSLRGSNVSDRRQRVRIAEAFDEILNTGFHVSRVKLDYVPGKALVEVVKDGHTNNTGECAVITENFGHHIEGIDYDRAGCDF
jgi:hypothetical protein